MANGYHFGHLRYGTFLSLQNFPLESALSECESFFRCIFIFSSFKNFIELIGGTLVNKSI